MHSFRVLALLSERGSRQLLAAGLSCMLSWDAYNAGQGMHVPIGMDCISSPALTAVEKALDGPHAADTLRP